MGPKEVCSVSKKPVKKYTPITGCTKEPVELCAPAGCGFKQGPESVMIKSKLLFKMLPRKTVTLSPRELVSMLPSLFQSCPQLRSVLMSPRKSVPDPEPTPELSRSQLLRNGVMFQLRNLVLLKMLQCSSISRTRLSLQLVL